MLTHKNIWDAIDKLAERHGLSASGLAKKGGLSSTLFNPSKRTNKKRERWPSTESIAAILRATNTSLDDFFALVSSLPTTHAKMPLIDFSDTNALSAFDPPASGDAQAAWDELPLPAVNDPSAFAIEISSKSLEPTYPEGTILILMPTEKPRRGDKVALCTQSGEIMIKLLGREGASKIELLPLNNETAPLTLARKDIRWLHRISWSSQ